MLEVIRPLISSKTPEVARPALGVYWNLARRNFEAHDQQPYKRLDLLQVVQMGQPVHLELSRDAAALVWTVCALDQDGQCLALRLWGRLVADAEQSQS